MVDSDSVDQGVIRIVVGVRLIVNVNQVNQGSKRFIGGWVRELGSNRPWKRVKAPSFL